MFMQWNFKTPSFFRTRSKRPAQRLSGGRPGKDSTWDAAQRGTGGGGHPGGSRRGQGPKGDSTHGAARAEAGGLPQPSSAPPSRRPEAVAASRRRLGSRRLRPRPPSEPQARPPALPPSRQGPQEGGKVTATGATPPPRPSGHQARATFGLAVGAVLVVLLPQQFGQDELVLLVQLLSLLPTGACRHVGGGAARRERGRADGAGGAGRARAPGAAGAAGGLGPGSGGGGSGWNLRRGGGGGQGSADVSRLLARPAARSAPAGKGRGGKSRDFREDGAVDAARAPSCPCAGSVPR